MRRCVPRIRSRHNSELAALRHFGREMLSWSYSQFDKKRTSDRPGNAMRSGVSQSRCPWRFALPLTLELGTISAAVPSLRGGLAIVTNVGMGCGGRGGSARDEHAASGRRSRVVLTPRRWRQVAGKLTLTAPDAFQMWRLEGYNPHHNLGDLGMRRRRWIELVGGAVAARAVPASSLPDTAQLELFKKKSKNSH